MTTSRRPARKPRRGTMESFGLGPVNAARSRIETCERYGMAVDPRDLAIVAESGATTAAEARAIDNARAGS